MGGRSCHAMQSCLGLVNNLKNVFFHFPSILVFLVTPQSFKLYFYIINMACSSVAKMDPPKIAFTVDLQLNNDDDVHSQMKTACKQLLHGWDAFKDTDIEVRF
jgi:hypothetical protein